MIEKLANARSPVLSQATPMGPFSSAVVAGPPSPEYKLAFLVAGVPHEGPVGWLRNTLWTIRSRLRGTGYVHVAARAISTATWLGSNVVLQSTAAVGKVRSRRRSGRPGSRAEAIPARSPSGSTAPGCEGGVVTVREASRSWPAYDVASTVPKSTWVTLAIWVPVISTRAPPVASPSTLQSGDCGYEGVGVGVGVRRAHGARPRRGRRDRHVHDRSHRTRRVVRATLTS